ncbi:MAG: fibronectin type III domain-containing protein [Phycisphaerales bacterium]|jgi:hypothetical protein
MTVQLYVGSTGGNRMVRLLYIGSTGGNRSLSKLYVGSAGGNRLVYERVAPTAPTAVVATLTGSTDYGDEIVVRWTPAGGTVTDQEIEHKTDAAAWTGIPQSTGISAASTTFKVLPLTDDTLYQFRVRGYNPVDGAGSWSSTAGANHEQYTYPSTPGTPSWTATYPKYKQATDDTLLLSWGPAADASEYDIHGEATTGFTPSSTNLIATVAATTYPNVGLGADSRMSYRIRSRHIATASTHDVMGAYGSQGTARTLIEKPGSFLASPLSTVTYTDLDLKWLNMNSTGAARLELMTLDRYAGGWTNVASTIPAGSTGWTDAASSTEVTKYRIKYNSEGTYTEALVPA